MFRPRFNLSLLFVLAALVAGVTEWLRQAVVRDRNIRALREEDFVSLWLTLDEEQYLNTKILNFFCKDQYLDQLDYLEIRVDRINFPETIKKYGKCDLGGTLRSLTLLTRSSDDEDRIAFSQIQFWMNPFDKVDRLYIEGGTLVNDIGELTPIQTKIQLLDIRETTIDVTTFRKIFQALQTPPRDVEFILNKVTSKFQAFQVLGIFTEDELEKIRSCNDFVE